MKKPQRTHAGEGAPRAAAMAVFAVIGICIALFVGCGTNGGSVSNNSGIDGPNPANSPTVAAAVPFQNEQMDFLTSDEKAGHGMIVSNLADVSARIYKSTRKSRASGKEGGSIVGPLIGITAKVLMSIGMNFANADKPNFTTVTNQLNNITSMIEQLNSEVTSIQKQLATAQVDIIEYMGNTYTTGNYVIPIDTAFNQGTNNLINFSQNAAYFDTSPAPPPPFTPAFPIPTPSPYPTPPFDPASSLEDVQSWVTTYATPIMQNQTIQTAVNGIATQINNENLLTGYVNYLILNPPGPSPNPTASPSPNPNFSTPNANLANEANVMSAYLLLEKYFLMLYTTQLKGLTVIQNADLAPCNNDPNGSLFVNYMNSTFKPELYQEVVNFNKAVDYLVLNLVDYRTQSQFNSDNQYLSQGIAKDTIYRQVLARSRFVSALILDSYGYNMNGLYGTIITPSKYTSDGNALTSLGLNLSGPQSVSITKTAEDFPSIYPYPRWSDSSGSSGPSNASVSMDNQWAAFDFITFDPTFTGIPDPPPEGSYFPNSLPAGTYTVTLNDGGSSTAPWNHTSNQLGEVQVQYYCPNGDTKDYPPTSEKTATNTMKFGFFSGRWNFGYEIFSNGPFSNWGVSDSNFDYMWQSFSCSYPNPALARYAFGGKYNSWSTDYAKYLYPYTGNAAMPEFIYQTGSYDITYTDKNDSPWFTGYKIYLPFTVSGSSSSTVNVSFIHNATGGFKGTSSTDTSNYMLYYGIYSTDTKTGDDTNLVDENNKFGSSVNWQGIKQCDYTPGREYQLKCTCYYENEPTGTFSQYLKWYLQLMFNGYVNIFN
jgi:hypothetical protein